MNFRKPLRIAAGLIISAILVWFDQYTKALAAAELKGNSPYVLWDGVFELYYTRNTGAAFGILQNSIPLFICITAVVMALLVWLYLQLPQDRHYRILRCMVFLTASGAAGNLIDRVRNHFVVDFFYFKLIDFPVFNMADVYISVAAVLTILLLLTVYRKDPVLQAIFDDHAKKQEDASEDIIHYE